MAHSNQKPAHLLTRFASHIDPETNSATVLDLACGYGRNGLYLARIGHKVIFADSNNDALEFVAARLAQEGLRGETWLVDLESAGVDQLPENEYSAILVFNYLHRPLLASIKRALKSAGVLFYETFTTDQPAYGRPHNPDYLLHPGELKSWLEDWHCIHYFEGDIAVDEGIELKGTKRKAIAQTVSIKG